MGQQIAPAIEMAIEDINRDPSILPGIVLDRHMYDHQCQNGAGIRGLVETMQNTTVRPLVGVIDGGCSSVSKVVADIANVYNFVSLSGVASSVMLADKSLYPSFLRTWTSMDDFVKPTLTVLKHFNWSKVGVIAENIERDMSGFFAPFLRAAPTSGINVTSAQAVSPGDNPGRALEVLRVADTRVFLLWTGPGLARRIFCEAYRKNMTTPATAWFIHDWYTNGWWRAADANVRCSAAEMDEAVRNHLGMTVNGLSPSDAERVPNGQFPSEWAASYGQRLQTLNGLVPSEMGYTSYDAAWAWAYALHDVINVRQELPSFEAIAQDSAAQTKMKAALYRVSFFGVSGHVSFDQTNGNRIGLAHKVVNQRPTGSVQVGVVDADGVLTLSLSEDIWWRDTKVINGRPAPVGAEYAPGDGSAGRTEIELVLWNDAKNGFGFIDDWASAADGKLLSNYDLPGTRIGVVATLLGALLMRGAAPLRTKFDFRLNLTMPALDRSRPRNYMGDTLNGDPKPSGSPGCRCLDGDKIQNARAVYTNATGLFTEQGHQYPLDYGISCKRHDVGLAPSCLPGMPNQPDWCEEAWCFVDQSCMLDWGVAGSWYFPAISHLGLGYSYETCGTRMSPAAARQSRVYDLPDRISMNYSDALFVAMDMCEELLQQDPLDPTGKLRVIVVALEPTVSPGYHPCWNTELHQELLYTPKIGMMIAEDEPLPDLMLAAVMALARSAVLRGLCIFILAAFVAAVFGWAFERNADGMFRRKKQGAPVPFLEGIDKSLYWAVTTGTIIIFALMAGALTNEIIVLTTDMEVYTLADIQSSTRAGIVGASFFAVEHLLLTKTPAHRLKVVTVDEGIASLRNRSLDVLLGAYPSLIEAQGRLEPGNPKIYITGDEIDRPLQPRLPKVAASTIIIFHANNNPPF
eukprot:g2376.t1